MEVLGCLPDELRARLDALGPDRAHRALVELLGYYEIQAQDRRYKEWEDAVMDQTGKSKSQRFLGDQPARP